MASTKYHAEQAMKQLEQVTGTEDGTFRDCLSLTLAIAAATKARREAALERLEQNDKYLRVEFTKKGLAMTYEEFLKTNPTCPTKFGKETCTLPWGHTQVECRMPGREVDPNYPVIDYADWVK